MRMTIGRMARAMNAMGDFESLEHREIGRIRTDSRLVDPGDIFFCLAGRNMDGHMFAAQAASRGAAAVIAHQLVDDLPEGCAVLLVRDTLNALGRLAADWRNQTKASVIGITGTAGKTTTKEILASVLGQAGPTAKTYKNYNNRLGLALSILQASGEERFWVMELGINEPGEMDDLGAMLRPDLAIVLNAGPCHLQGLGTMEALYAAKASLLAHLPAHGQALVNAENNGLVQACKQVFPRLTLFSADSSTVPISCTYNGLNSRGKGSYHLCLPDHEIDVNCSFWGRAMAQNLAAAAGAAALLGLSPQTIAHGLESVPPMEQRFVVRELSNMTLIDDTYNANPLSMVLSMERARELAGARPLVLVLGDMLELGNAAEEEHRALGLLAAESGCAALFFHGENAEAVRQGCRNMPGVFRQLQAPELLIHAVEEGLIPRDAVILFKGSRGCRMDRYIKAMVGGAV